MSTKNAISLTFGELTAQQAHELLEAHRLILTGERVTLTDKGRQAAEEIATMQANQQPAVPAHETQALGGNVDDRGVPHHPDYHAPSFRKTVKGAWARRKGVDKDAADAYENQYLGQKPPQQPTAPMAGSLPPGMVPNPMNPGNPVPLVPQKVSYDEFANLWQRLVGENKLTTDDVARINAEAGIIDQNEYYNDENKRAIFYMHMKKLAA